MQTHRQRLTPAPALPTLVILWVLLTGALLRVCGGSLPPPPDTITVKYSEKNLDLTWSAVPGADGYHIYTSDSPGVALAKRRRVNPSLVTSGTHFTYIWDINGKTRERAVKGNRHYLVITSVSILDADTIEGAPSHEVDNYYYEGFDRMSSAARVAAVMQRRQDSPHLPIDARRNPEEAFIEFMTGPCTVFQKLIGDTIDFREMGACAPLSTVLVQLMLQWGLQAWKVEGTFIKEYHSFAVINIDRVEYVVDVSADQFVPGVVPVVIPRDFCHLNARGRLDRDGTPVYEVGKIFAPEKSRLVEGEQGELYRYLYRRVLEKTGRKGTGEETK